MLYAALSALDASSDTVRSLHASVLASELHSLQAKRAPTPRTWFYLPYDQLTDELGPWSRLAPQQVGIVLVETAAKARRRPYHQQKLAFLLANQRRFALEQAARGVAVEYLISRESYATVLAAWVTQHQPLVMMEAAERELRVELADLVKQGLLSVVAHEGWLTRTELFEQACGVQSPWRMDAFYREARRATGILMERGKPLGGRFSFDGENRKPWSGTPPAPVVPRFQHGALEAEVEALVRTQFGTHPGRVDLGALPTTKAHAHECWDFALRECLEHFGPYEDAMSRSSRTLFHTRIAHLLNVSRLLPVTVVKAAVQSTAPLASVEGFVRQVLGWREFVRHVHRATDGFRDLPGVPRAQQVRATDAGWWTLSGLVDRPHHAEAAPAALAAHNPLPPAWWGHASGLACLDRVVRTVMEDAWCHHIERLMVLANIAALLDVDARELTDWFWCAFVDAYDWVVEPNVLSMGTFATGDVMTTKPYIAGSAYIDKMSDDCAGCAFTPGKDCPLTSLYWAYLDRHAQALAGNPRLLMPLRSLAKRDPAKRSADARVYATVSAVLAKGARLDPKQLM